MSASHARQMPSKIRQLRIFLAQALTYGKDHWQADLVSAFLVSFNAPAPSLGRFFLPVKQLKFM